MEDIDHRQFHSFLVEPPQGRRSRSSGTSASEAGDVDDSDGGGGGGDLQQQDLQPENNQKKRGIDWSQKLRERNRRKIWRQFRLN